MDVVEGISATGAVSGLPAGAQGDAGAAGPRRRVNATEGHETPEQRLALAVLAQAFVDALAGNREAWRWLALPNPDE